MEAEIGAHGKRQTIGVQWQTITTILDVIKWCCHNQKWTQFDLLVIGSDELYQK